MTILLRKLLIAGAILFLLTVMFPPWLHTLDRTGVHPRRSAGYHFLFAAPEADSNFGAGIQLDYGRLALEWLAVAAALGLVWLFVHPGKPAAPFTPPTPPG